MLNISNQHQEGSLSRGEEGGGDSEERRAQSGGQRAESGGRRAQSGGRGESRVYVLKGEGSWQLAENPEPGTLNL